MCLQTGGELPRRQWRKWGGSFWTGSCLNWNKFSGFMCLDFPGRIAMPFYLAEIMAREFIVEKTRNQWSQCGELFYSHRCYFAVDQYLKRVNITSWQSFTKIAVASFRRVDTPISVYIFEELFLVLYTSLLIISQLFGWTVLRLYEIHRYDSE